MKKKSSVDEIRARFDQDVERFSNLETGQSATMDAQHAMALVAEVAAVSTPHATRVLDIGCGAGNYSLMLLNHLPHLDVTLLDLSQPMLDRARQRVAAATKGEVACVQSDIRKAELSEGGYDIILAAAVLHHLRDDQDWQHAFERLHRALRPGGSMWVFDLIETDHPAVRKVMWNRYGAYLEEFRDPDYRAHVFQYIEQEDTPRSLLFQIDLMRQVGFAHTEILHKNSCFAAFGGIKSAFSGHD